MLTYCGKHDDLVQFISDYADTDRAEALEILELIKGEIH